MTIPLGPRSLGTSCGLPGDGTGAHSPLFGLAPSGVYPPPCHHGRPGALTSRFHPYPLTGAVCFCGTLRRVAPPGCYPAPLPGGARTFLSPHQRGAATQPTGPLPLYPRLEPLTNVGTARAAPSTVGTRYEPPGRMWRRPFRSQLAYRRRPQLPQRTSSWPARARCISWEGRERPQAWQIPRPTLDTAWPRDAFSDW